MASSEQAPSSTPESPTDAQNTVEINVKAPTDSKITLRISKEKTVADLKQLISENEQYASEDNKLPPSTQRLIYSGRILKDEDVLSKYKISSGNTIHLVKGKPQTPAPPTDQQVPSQISSGQEVQGNPLAPLMNAQNAGAIGAMGNPFASMGINSNDPNMAMNMLDNPEVQRHLASLLQNDEVLDQIISSSPELRALGPQAREIMRSPMFREMMTNPDTLRMMGSMSRGGTGGLGGSGPGMFGGPGGQGQGDGAGAGATEGDGAGTGGQQQPFNLFNPPSSTASTGQTQSAESGAASGGGAGGNPNLAQQLQQMQQFISAFGGGQEGGAGGAGATGGGGGAGLAGLGGLGGLGGAAGGGTPSAPADTRPAEERFEEQLSQLANMGFSDTRANIRALQATGGNVQFAVEYLLGDNS